MDNQASNKRQRVSKGSYNQYLRCTDPLKHAPQSSRRKIQQNEHMQSSMEFNDTEHAENDSDGILQQEELALLHSSQDASGDVLVNGEESSGNNLQEESCIESTAVLDDHSDIYSSRDFESGNGITNIDMDSDRDINGYSDVDGENEASEDEISTPQDTDFADTDQSVYPGSSLKLSASMLLIMKYAMKHSLTGEGISELLSLIGLHCMPGHMISQSLSMFKKWFQHIKSPLNIHNYCNSCHILLEKEDISKNVCKNAECSAQISEETVSHFIELPIRSQIVALFRRPSFMEDIKHRFTRTKEHSQSIEDVYDGEIYKGLSKEGGILSQPHNISLLWNTDGIPCFKSSKMSLWPLFFQINELPYKKRRCSENMILGGLWFGPKKPTVMSFTKPFISSLQSLEKEGVLVETEGKTIHSKVCVIGGVADMPARSLICNTMQFNGNFGCCKCLQPGETHKTSERGHVHIFPLNKDDPTGPKRSHDQSMIDAALAVQLDKPSHGIKGPSFLNCLSHYDLVASTCIDYMHGVLLGVTKLLLSLWFSSEHSSKSFSLYGNVDVVDSRLEKIQPPNNIKRLPRSIKEHLNYWKASEFRSWLLFYSLPVLRDIQEETYFQHYLLFVNAIYLLLQDSISPEDINKAYQLLVHFCTLFAFLYGDRYMTCNIHQLLHLPDNVRDMGPLWAYSCFPFEDANGNLLDLFNGTQKIDFQIVETVNLNYNMTQLQTKYLHSGTPEASLFETISGQKHRRDCEIETGIFIVGRAKRLSLPKEQMEVITKYLGHYPMHYLIFSRIRINNEIYHSRIYKRTKSRNSFTIAFRSCNKIAFGQVQCYIQLYPVCPEHGKASNLCTCNTAVNAALVEPFENVYDDCSNKLSKDSLTDADVSFIHELRAKKPCNSNKTFELVAIERICYKCVYIEVKDKPEVVFVASMPNSVEME